MNLILQTSIVMIANLKKFVYSDNHSLIILFRAQSSLIRDSWFRAHNSLIRSIIESINRPDDGLGLVWAKVAQSSGQSSEFGLIRGQFRLARSDQRQFQAHIERTRCFERTSVWSEDTLVWDCLIRGYFRLEQSDQRSLPDCTSTWVEKKFVSAEISNLIFHLMCSQKCWTFVNTYQLKTKRFSLVH